MKANTMPWMVPATGKALALILEDYHVLHSLSQGNIFDIDWIKPQGSKSPALSYATMALYYADHEHRFLEYLHRYATRLAKRIEKTIPKPHIKHIQIRSTARWRGFLREVYSPVASPTVIETLQTKSPQLLYPKLP